VLQGLQTAFGIEGDALWTAATGFGGGLGRRQLVCGALAGGVIALGLEVARRRESTRADRAGLRDETYAKVQALTKQFEGRFGALDCRTLTQHDFSVPEGYQAFTKSGMKDSVCHPAVRFVVETVAELMG
jgi:C_GCAxxG_C_C family probable redox protein